MKTSACSLLALTSLLSLTTAAPLAGAQAPPGSIAAVRCIGATDDPSDEYTIDIIVGAGPQTVTHAVDPYRLSISRVNYDHGAYACTFYGVDEATAPPVEANGQLGPPQTVTAIACDHSWAGDKRDAAPDADHADLPYIEMQLLGATDGYWLQVQLDGSPTPTYNDLSISTVQFDWLHNYCQFNGVDGTANLQYGDLGSGTLGPPQTIVSVACIAEVET
ncbi:MAG: hypothetical protein M1818_007087 [Claussenomyces sp. TS43310]|nr:MAG: hypothetical protein M1818_007087 [Claussenomyces sp. TS43310]